MSVQTKGISEYADDVDAPKKGRFLNKQPELGKAGLSTGTSL